MQFQLHIRLSYNETHFRYTVIRKQNGGIFVTITLKNLDWFLEIIVALLSTNTWRTVHLMKIKYLSSQMYWHLFQITVSYTVCMLESIKGKVLPYSLTNVGPRADPAGDYKSSRSGRLPLLSAMTAFYLRNRSPDGATPNWDNTHLITAYYSSIDPEGMKGWVDLFGWPIADGLPT